MFLLVINSMVLLNIQKSYNEVFDDSDTDEDDPNEEIGASNQQVHYFEVPS